MVAPSRGLSREVAPLGVHLNDELVASLYIVLILQDLSQTVQNGPNWRYRNGITVDGHMHLKTKGKELVVIDSTVADVRSEL